MKNSVMAQYIKVFIADDMVELRSNVRRMLAACDNIRIVGEAGDGEEAIQKIREVSPHVVLMDINMPKLDGLRASEILTKERPNTQIVIMSIQNEQEYFRRAMKAGAKDFLTKPFSGNELIDTIQNVFNKWIKDVPGVLEQENRAQFLTFFSTKGGVGKTTLAANLGVALAKLGKKALLIDASLQFGDVAIMLNQKNTKNIYSIVESSPDEISDDNVEKNILHHSSGLDLLLAPTEPAFADAIKPQHIKQILDKVSSNYKFVLLDTAPHIGELELAVLDRTDLLFLVATLEISALKNTKMCLKTFSALNIDMSKIKLVLNKDFPNAGIASKDIETGLAIPIFTSVPMENETAQQALNQGEAFVIKSPGSYLAKAVMNIAKILVSDGKAVQTQEKGLFNQLKSVLFGS